MVLDVGRRARRVDLDVRACGRSRTAARSARPGRGRRRTPSASGGSPRTPSARRAAARARPRASPAPGRPRTAPRRTPSRPGRRRPSGTAAARRRPAPAGPPSRSRRPSGAAWRSIAAGQVERHRVRALAPQPARARRRAGPDLQHPRPGDVAEQSRVGLAQPLRAPDEVGVADVAAVLGQVVVGVGVPPAPAGPFATRSNPPPRRATPGRPEQPARRSADHVSVPCVHGRIVTVRGARHPHCPADRAPRSMVRALWSTSRPAVRLLPDRLFADRRLAVHRLAPSRGRSPRVRTRIHDARVTAPRHDSVHNQTAPPIHPPPEHPTTCPPTPPPPRPRPAGRRQRHRVGGGFPRRHRPDDQVLQRWRHRRRHHRQGRPGRGPARHRLQDRGRHPLARAVDQARRRPRRGRVGR